MTIITPSYNQADFLPATIESVLNQQGNFELDYQIYDGGSTDGSVEIIRSYEDRLQWRSEKDGGQVNAVNRGLQECGGDIVGWVNSDDILMPGAIDEVVRTFQERQCDWLHGDCVIIDENGNEIRNWIRRYKRRQALKYSRKRLLIRNFVSQMTVFWRRSLIDQVGWLDPALDLAFDYDYWLRLSKLSDPVYIDRPLAAFRWYHSSKSGANFSRQFDQDREIAMKHGPLKGWPKLQKEIMRFAIVSTYRILSIAKS